MTIAIEAPDGVFVKLKRKVPLFGRVTVPGTSNTEFGC